MKKLNFLFLGLLSFMPIWGCNDDDSLPEAVVEVKEGHNEDIVSVIDYDIKNDGTLQTCMVYLNDGVLVK